MRQRANDPQMGDIKNMYTELKHSIILDALHWAIDTFKATTRSRHPTLSVPKYGSKGVYVGRTNMTDEVYITFKEIIEIVKFDLENAIFTLGENITLQQLIGIPMGSPLSAALAPLVCIYFEHKLFTSLSRTTISSPQDGNIPMAEYTGLTCTGVRYMDDQIAIAAYHKKDKLGKKLAIKFVNMLADCYDEKMIMENEATNISENRKIKSHSSFPFLEATVEISKHKIIVKHLNKNEEFINKFNKQKRFRYHHFESFTPDKQKMGTIIGTIIRMSRYTTNEPDLVASINLTIRELTLLEYPEKFIKKTLQKIYRKDTKKWKCLPNIYNKL